LQGLQIKEDAENCTEVLDGSYQIPIKEGLSSCLGLRGAHERRAVEAWDGHHSGGGDKGWGTTRSWR